MPYEKYRSKKVVEAKELPHDGHFFDPRTGAREPFHKGDFAVIEDGKTRIENGERFRREHERVYTTPPTPYDTGEGY
jgi:hypothetical protein